MSKQLSFFDPPTTIDASLKNTKENTKENIKKDIKLEDIKKNCLGCNNCALSKSRQQVVFGAGNAQADIMVIGQGPSKSDDGTGLPYSGPSGDVLDKALAEVGLNRADIWLTNIHKCLSYDAKNRKLRPPRVDEIEACSQWLAAEIRLVKPKVIVCLGGPAAKVLIDKKFKLNEQRGQWYRSKVGQVKILATYQPAYLMRLKQWDRPATKLGWQALLADLTKAVAVVKA